MKTRKVKITLTNKVVGSYEARSYPHDDYDNDGNIELYKVALYEIVVEGQDATGTAKIFSYRAPRFMPYWNDPKNPSSHYKTKGWVNAGLSKARTITVKEYKENYEVQNRYSPGKGAIVLEGSFYIHAGPGKESDVGFGSAGCVEVVGFYDKFKADIALLSGSSYKFADGAIKQLVAEGNLIVVIQEAPVPNIKSAYTRSVPK